MKIGFLGDIALIGKFDQIGKSREKTRFFFNEILEELKNCDHVVANLEAPFTSLERTKEAKTLPLKSDPKNVCILKEIGVDYVCLANNHTYDYGNKGVEECVRILEKNRIGYFGIDEIDGEVDSGKAGVLLGGFCCRTTNGWHYGGKGHTKGINQLEGENIGAFLGRAKRKKIFPILEIHWGDENTHYPRLEHLRIASDIAKRHGPASIIGHHPHVIQGIVKDEKSVVAFSLGNFCFDDCISTTGSGVKVIQTEENKCGYIVILDIEEEGIQNCRIIPYRDIGDRLIVDDSLYQSISDYSKSITRIQDKKVYQNLRQGEIDTAFAKRLGKRDLNWLVHHINSVSVKSVMQRKYNAYAFRTMTGEFHRKMCMHMER